MVKEKIIVNSWNEWDPLKHVIVGRADGVCIPAPEPALDAKVPEDSDMKGKFGLRTKDTIDKAKNILLQPNKSISEVAYELGFEYPQYFSRLFKKKEGISPTEYREKYKLN